VLKASGANLRTGQPIYDVFSDFDNLADAVGSLLTGLQSTDPPTKEDRKELIEKLRRAIKDMRRLIARHSWPGRAQSAPEDMIAKGRSRSSIHTSVFGALITAAFMMLALLWV